MSSIKNNSCCSLSLEQVIDALKNHQVVALPTETVYGLAAKADSLEAIYKIYALKNRPRDNPLILHVSDFQEAKKYLDKLPPKYLELTEAFWPGPLTLIAPLKEGVLPKVVTAHQTTLAVRVPNHSAMRAIIKEVGPLVAPSANLSGRPSATSPSHITQDFSNQLAFYDGGKCAGGLESTILFYNKEIQRWEVARLGGLSAEEISRVLGYVPNERTKDKAPICPGQHYRHYAPSCKLILTKEFKTDHPVLGYRDRSYPRGQAEYLLGDSKQPAQVAKNLYAALRDLDLAGTHCVCVDMKIPHGGIWKTIRERLIKASSSASL